MLALGVGFFLADQPPAGGGGFWIRGCCDGRATEGSRVQGLGFGVDRL